MARTKIPALVLKQIGARLSKKGLRDAGRLLARHLSSDSRIWRQVFDHIAAHFADDAARAGAKMGHGVFDKAFHSYDALKKLLLEACTKPSHAPYFSSWEGKPRIILEKQFQKVIGHVGKDKEPTTVLRIVIDHTGRPITAFPIAKSQIGKAGGVAASGALIAAAEGAYASEPVRTTYAEEIDAQKRLAENTAFDRAGGWSGVAVDVALDILSLGLLSADATGLDRKEVASRGEVNVRADEAVQRVETRWGSTLDEQTRQQIRDDVLEIWGYLPLQETAGNTAPAQGTVRIHEVKLGETLSSIAEKYYGRSGDWRRLYAANYSQIGPNPDQIRAGQKLIIPRDGGG